MHLKEAFKEFSSQTTFHGIRYIGDSKVRLIRRFIWLLLVLTAFGLLTLVIVLRVIYFSTSPKTVNIDIEYPDEVTFPAVTVCNQNFIRASVAIDRGLYDSLRRDFDKIRQQGADKDKGVTCQDTFYGYVNTSLWRESNPKRDADVVFKGVTSEVCQHLCINGPKLRCNGVLYNKMTTECSLTSKMLSSPDVERMDASNEDYLRRIRCESPADMSCSFEADLCNFTQSTEDDDDWKRVSGSVVVSFTGPDVDHTTGKGSYIYMDLTTGGRASLLSPTISAGVKSHQQRCVQFYYHMYGEHVAELRVSVLSGDRQEVLVWKQLGNQGNRWRRGFFAIPSDLFQVRFTGIGSSGAQGHVALDDIRIAKCSLFRTDCKVMAEGAEYRGSISRTRSGKRCMNWKVASGLLPINPQHFPDDSLTEAENFCRNPNGEKSRPWCYTDTKEESWETCDIPFCECGQTDFQCGNGRCVPQERLCDGGDDCGDATDETLRSCNRSVTCNFEQLFLCGYRTLAKQGEYNWRFTRQATRSFGTGPAYDNTIKSVKGGYVYVDATYGLEADVTTLLSPPYPSIDPICLRFSYHMYGPHVGTLRVMVVNDDRYFQLYAVDGPQEDRWQAVALTMSHHYHWGLTGDIRIAFVAVRGNGTQGDIAVDGVSVVDTPCPVTEETECKDRQCMNGLCIRSDQLCDGNNDCLDNTDEKFFCDSLTCSFEEASGCGYTMTSSHPDVGWARRRRADPHITISDGYTVWNDTNDRYMFSTAASVGRPNIVSVLYTPWQYPFEDGCTTYLWKPQGSTAGILEVYKQLYGMEPERVNIHLRDESPHWLQQYIPVDAHRDVRFIFKATSIYIGSDVAVDDVRLQYGSTCKLSQVSINCTFEDSWICGYSVDFYGDFIWSRTDDKPMGGKVMSTDQLAISGPNMTLLTSPWQRFASLHCLAFSYKMNGLRLGILTVLVEDANHTRQIWRKSGDQGPAWKTAKVVIPEGYHRILFEAIRGYEKYTYIAVDNITALPGSCSVCRDGFLCDNGRCVEQNVVCDGFDDCLDMSDEVRVCDSTCRLSTRGEFYTGQVNTTRSRLPCVNWEDVNVTSRGAPSVVFAGRTLGGVLNHCRNPHGIKDEPWCYTSHQGNWDYCDIEQCECARNQFECHNGRCVSLTVRCDGNNDCGDFSDEDDGCDISITCKFDDPFRCGYRMDETGAPYTWHQWYGKGSVEWPGPRVKSEGGYMFSGSFTSLNGAKARLYSPNVTLSAPHCLTLNYYMADPLSRNLLIYRVRNGNVLNVLDTRNITRGNLWLPVAYDIPAGPAQLMFEATLNRDVIGIDEVKLAQGTCRQADLQLYKCYHGATGVEYNGTLNQTVAGTGCIRWTAQNDSLYLRSAPRPFVDGSAQDIDNYCRNPNNSIQPWCYTRNDHFGFCDVGDAAEIICPTAPEDFCPLTQSYRCTNGRCIDQNRICDGVNDCGDGSDETLPCQHTCTRTKRGEFYTGAEQTTQDGTVCDSWSKVRQADLGLNEYILPQESLEESSNFCRNPDMDDLGLWCYVNGGQKRRYCDVPMCPGFSYCSQEYEFRCDDGRCIAREKECNGVNDCVDGSDEVRPCGDRSIDRLSIHKECRVSFKGTEYLGMQNVTRGALPCQRWIDQEPHRHRYATGLEGAENYCRNPDGVRDYPWCFTTDPAVEWDYCDIPICMCDLGLYGLQYIGTLNRADNGIPCLPWVVTSEPQIDLPDPSLEAASNFCRMGDHVKPFCPTLAVGVQVDCTVPLCPGTLNPRSVTCNFESRYICGYTTRIKPYNKADVSHTQKAHAWKFSGSPYTMQSSVFKDFLDTRNDICIHNETRGGDYRGKESKTQTGKTCQRWDAQYPHKYDQYSDEHFPVGENKTLAENYCRNPRLDLKVLWCFTTDPNVRWERCDIPSCRESVMLAVPGEVPGVAELVSPPFNASTATVHCLHFDYILFGRGAGSLAVLLENARGERRQLWRITGNQGFKLKSTFLEIHDYRDTWRVVFASYQSYSNTSTALDHVVMETGPCAEKKKCGEGEFACQTGHKCLPKGHGCDRIDDCGDNSDEINCVCPEFRCNNGRCVSHILRLDGYDDCYDNSDEVFVPGITALPDTRTMVDGTVLPQRGLPQHDYELYPKLDMDGPAFRKFLLEASHQKEDMIHRCTWNNAPCETSDISRTLTDFGVCYTFNNDVTRPLTIKQRGSNYGLKLVINTESYEAMEGLHSASGVKVHLHKQGTIPPVSELGFVLSPGQNAMIEVAMTNTTRLPRPWGKCSSTELRYFTGYDIATCRLECETRTTIERCGCIAHHMPLLQTQDSSLYCGVRDYFDCYLSQLKYNQRAALSCDCPEPCDEISYTPYISYGSLTDKSTSDFLASERDKNKLSTKLTTALDAADHKNAESYVDSLNVFYDLFDHHDTVLYTLETLKSSGSHSNKTVSVFRNVEKAVEIFLKMYENTFDATEQEFNKVFQEPLRRIRVLRDLLVSLNQDARHAYRKLAYLDTSSSDTVNVSSPRTGYEAEITLNIQSLVDGLGDNMDVPVSLLLAKCPQGGTHALRNATRSFKELGEAFLLASKYSNHTKRFLQESRQRFSTISDSLLECLDSPLRMADNLREQLNQNRPRKYYDGPFGRLQSLLRDLSVRELRIAVTQVRQLYKGSIDMYQQGSISKLMLLTELQNGIIEYIQGSTDFAINTILTLLYHPYLQTLRQLFFDLKRSYFDLLAVLDQVQTYMPGDFHDTIVISMELWKRPLVELEASVGRLSPRYDNDEIDTYANLSLFLQTRARGVIDEHVLAFSEPLYYRLQEYVRTLIGITRKLETIKHDVDELILSTLAKAQLDKNFLRDNFMLAEFYVSQLSYQKVADQKAFGLEDLMGDVGGYMGLLVGGSLISVMEILDLFMFYICSRLWLRRREVKAVEGQEH